jgi:UDP-2-acetamido-2-deoxy-ribo-hexuluronate aminotransferase
MSEVLNKIQMVDLKSQYEKIKPAIDKAIIGVVESSQYINLFSKKWKTTLE